MDWGADVLIAGTLASVGARLIEGTANKMIGQTFDCMKLEARAPRRLTADDRWSASHGSSGRSRRTSTSSPTPRTREAIAIDTAIPSLAWIADELAARDWTLKLIVSTHGHWDHIGDNAAVAAHTGAEIAVHPLDRDAPRAPAAALGAVRDPAVACRRSSSPRAARSGSARSGCGSCTRRATREGSVCLLCRRRGPAVQRRHAVRRRLGPDRPARRRPGGDGRVARPAARARGPGRPSCPVTAARRRSAAERPWLELVRERRALPRLALRAATGR